MINLHESYMAWLELEAVVVVVVVVKKVNVSYLTWVHYKASDGCSLVSYLTWAYCKASDGCSLVSYLT